MEKLCVNIPGALVWTGHSNFQVKYDIGEQNKRKLKCDMKVEYDHLKNYSRTSEEIIHFKLGYQADEVRNSCKSLFKVTSSNLEPKTTNLFMIETKF